jgi:hypothetical protein
MDSKASELIMVVKSKKKNYLTVLFNKKVYARNQKQMMEINLMRY